MDCGAPVFRGTTNPRCVAAHRTQPLVLRGSHLPPRPISLKSGNWSASRGSAKTSWLPATPDDVDVGVSKTTHTVLEMAVGLETVFETFDDIAGERDCIDLVRQRPLDRGVPSSCGREFVDADAEVIDPADELAGTTAQVDVAHTHQSKVVRHISLGLSPKSS